jgi:hypothetical protein
MSNHDDEDIEFDFFDEPETVEATQRRRLPRLELPGGGRSGGGGPEQPPPADAADRRGSSRCFASSA